jgi:CYTH domain-containing protein
VYADRDIQAEVASPKYAQMERERRSLVDLNARPDMSAHAATLIEDRYLANTRLRLRRMSRPADGWCSFKLTKKNECNDASIRPIVTSYLSAAEYAVFLTLPGADLVKRRYRFDHLGKSWSLDIFDAALAGLELVECEVEDVEALKSLVPPAWATREITFEPRFQCGALAYSQQIPEI